MFLSPITNESGEKKIDLLPVLFCEARQRRLGASRILKLTCEGVGEGR